MIILILQIKKKFDLRQQQQQQHTIQFQAQQQ